MTRDEQQIKTEIEQVRQDLGETVEALVYKADLPARAKERGAQLTAQARQQVRQVPRSRWLAIGGGLAALVGVLLAVRVLRSR